MLYSLAAKRIWRSDTLLSESVIKYRASLIELFPASSGVISFKFFGKFFFVKMLFPTCDMYQEVISKAACLSASCDHPNLIRQTLRSTSRSLVSAEGAELSGNTILVP